MPESNLDTFLSSSLDQPVPLDLDREVFGKIDVIVNRAIAEKNGWIALDGLAELRKVALSASIGLAKFLHDIVKNWDKFGIDENMYAVILDRTGIVKYTVDRYVFTWEHFTNPASVPPEYAQSILGRGISSALKVAKMLEGGHIPTEDQWEDLVNAPDRAALEDTIREISHAELSPKVIYIQMEMTGEVYVYHLNQKHYAGKLETGSGVYAVQKAIDRMCLGGGVSRK